MHTFNGSRSKKPLPKSTIQLVPDNTFRITALIMRGSQLSNFGWSFPGPWLRARLRRSSCSAKHFYLQLKRRNIPAWTFILRDGDDKSHSTVSISVCQAAQSRLNHNYIFFSPQAEEKGTNLGKSTISGRHDSLLLNKTVTHTQDLNIKVFLQWLLVYRSPGDKQKVAVVFLYPPGSTDVDRVAFLLKNQQSAPWFVSVLSSGVFPPCTTLKIADFQPIRAVIVSNPPRRRRCRMQTWQ